MFRPRDEHSSGKKMNEAHISCNFEHVNTFNGFIDEINHLYLCLEVVMSEMVTLLGKRVRELRRELKYTQDELAEKVGISGKYLGEVERGEANVSVQILEGIAMALGVPVQEFFVNEHWKKPEVLTEEISSQLNEASSDQVRLIYRIVNDVLR